MVSPAINFHVPGLVNKQFDPENHPFFMVSLIFQGLCYSRLVASPFAPRTCMSRSQLHSHIHFFCILPHGFFKPKRDCSQCSMVTVIIFYGKQQTGAATLKYFNLLVTNTYRILTFVSKEFGIGVKPFKSYIMYINYMLSNMSYSK